MTKPRPYRTLWSAGTYALHSLMSPAPPAMPKRPTDRNAGSVDDSGERTAPAAALDLLGANRVRGATRHVPAHPGKFYIEEQAGSMAVLILPQRASVSTASRSPVTSGDDALAVASFSAAYGGRERNTRKTPRALLVIIRGRMRRSLTS